MAKLKYLHPTKRVSTNLYCISVEISATIKKYRRIKNESHELILNDLFGLSRRPTILANNIFNQVVITNTANMMSPLAKKINKYLHLCLVMV